MPSAPPPPLPAVTEPAAKPFWRARALARDAEERQYSDQRNRHNRQAHAPSTASFTVPCQSSYDPRYPGALMSRLHIQRQEQATCDIA